MMMVLRLLGLHDTVGGIIPQIEVRQHTDHIPGKPNPIFIHLYPGRKTNVRHNAPAFPEA